MGSDAPEPDGAAGGPPETTASVERDAPSTRRPAGGNELESTPERSTCGCCAEPVATDVERCPICGYRPAGYSPRLTLLWEVGAAALLLVAVATFAIGVGGAVLDVPVGAFSQLAIVTPYVSGFSGFFAYYHHQKRQLTPADDRVFG